MPRGAAALAVDVHEQVARAHIPSGWNLALPTGDLPARPVLHIDWLSVSQVHADAPEWGKSRMVEFDLQSGEVLWTSTRSGSLEGSYDTRVQVRSTGGVVYFSGNPSKWGRADAVSRGCRSMAQALDVASGILRSAGLPGFSFPDRTVLSSPGRGVDTVRHGPLVREVHIAGVRLLGGPAQVACFMDWLSTQRFGRKGNPYQRQKGGQSMRAGSKRGVESAIYDKGEEVAERAREWKRKRCGDGGEQERVCRYLEALSDRLKALGAVRDEQRWHRQALKRVGYEWAEEWGDETMHKLWQAQALKVVEIGGVVDWNGEAKRRLLALGLSERKAVGRLDVLSSWMSGRDVREGRSVSAFYQIAADLRAALGVDIRDRPNVVTLGSKAQQLARPVTARWMTEADAEALYAGLPELREVAA